jgi:Protein of unknown function (DUF2442)
MKPPKITAAQAIDDRTLIIEFSNQETKRYDISQLFNKPMFEPLKNPGFFKNFSLEPGGYGIVWNADVDISEYELWKNGVSVASTALADARGKAQEVQH